MNISIKDKLIHEKYMHRCLELAHLAIGNTSPNPMVGSVIVFENKIIGEGYHRKIGENHAEINAIESVKDKILLKKATLYVNLEPCAHHGLTPPCSDRIIKEKIPQVVIGCSDSFEKVSGKGIEKLKKNGHEVVLGILEKESRELNRRFFVFNEKQRPYIILKWAQTRDGFIDLIRRPNAPIRPHWITDEVTRTLVHKWRTEEDAILVGTNTAMKDNPKLNVRDWQGKNPVRIVLDRKLRLRRQLSLFDQKIKTLVFNSQKNETIKNIKYIKISFTDNNNELIEQILEKIHKERIQSVIIEGGSQVLKSFIDSGYWDEARVFIGTKLFKKGVAAPVFDHNYTQKINFSGSDLLIYRNP